MGNTASESETKPQDPAADEKKVGPDGNKIGGRGRSQRKGRGRSQRKGRGKSQRKGRGKSQRKGRGRGRGRGRSHRSH